MDLPVMAWTAIILVLVFLSLTVAPTWPMAFLILFGMIVSSFKKWKNSDKGKGPILPTFSRDPPLDQPFLTDDAGGMGRKPETSSISSSLSGFKYDVYLSSSGSDACHGITDCIKKRLEEAGIRVSRNKDELLEGKEIRPALEEAIKQSRISIAILSRNYASSKSCLGELVQMWECMKLNGQTVFPILYKVSPAELRYQAGYFGRSFNLLKANRVESNTIETWREVLRQIGKLSGYIGEKRNGPESLLVKEIAARVVRVLNKDDQVVTDKLVGIDRYVEEMIGKLGVASSDGQATEVRVVGVCGERGVGKTTLAKVVFNKTRKFFHAYSFLEGISSKGVQVSRRRLIADLQIKKSAPLESSGEEIEEMASLCRNVRVLIVLDDVDNEKQIKALAGNLAWFGPGSRIIVTTKKKNVLNAFDIRAVEDYPLEPMDQSSAHKLFCKHAFQGYAAADVSEYFGLSMDIAKAIGGLPSDIVHQASPLRDDMNMERWKTTLVLLQKKPKKHRRTRA